MTDMTGERDHHTGHRAGYAGERDHIGRLCGC